MMRYSVVFLCLSLLLTACPDPEGKYNRYIQESAESDALLRKDQIIEDQSMSDEGLDGTIPVDQFILSCDPNGKYFLGLFSYLYLTNRIGFLTEIQSTKTDGKNQITKLLLQPLNCSDRTKAEGDPIIIEGNFPISDDGSFEIALGEVNVTGPANCQTGREIKANITLQAQLNADCSFMCGKVVGDLILPFATSLTDNTTFGADRVSGLDALMPMDQPKKACDDR